MKRETKGLTRRRKVNRECVIERRLPASQAREALRESEEKYRAIVENSPNLVGILQDGILKYVNNVAVLNLGWTKEELLSPSFDSIEKVVSEKSRSVLKENLARRLHGERIAPYEISLVKKDGSKVPVMVRAAKIIYNQRPAIEFVFDDLTDRNLMEEKLLALHKHGSQLSAARSIDTVVKHTLDAMEFTLGFSSADFSLVDAERRRLHLKGKRGMAPSFSELPLDGPGVTVKAANTGRTIRLSDTRKEEAYVDDEGRAGKEVSPVKLSELAVPVVIDNEVVAVLNVESTRLNAFTDEDQILVETLATHVASCLTRLKHEEALRESEERYRSLFDRMLDGIYLSTHEGRFVDVNPTFVKMFGYSSKQEMLDITDIKKELYFSPEERGSHILDTGQPEVEVYRMRRKNGSEIWVEDHGRYVHDERGKIIYHEGILRDVTERRHSEKALQEANQFNRAIISGAREGIIVYDRNLNYRVWNQYMEELTGVPAQRVLGKDALDLFPHLREQRVDLLLKRALLGETVASPDTPFHVDQTGKSGWVSGVYGPHRDTQGEIIGVIGVLRDVTQRRLGEQKLRLQAEITENMFEGLVLTRAADGVIVQTNPRFDAMFGYNPGELIGRNIATVNAPIDGKSPEDIAKEIQASIRGTGSWRGEVRNVKKDGTPFWCQANVSALGSSEYGAIWIATHEDITERKRLEQALRRRAQELESLQKTLLEITGHRELTQLLNSIVERAAQLLDAAGGGMYLCEPDSQEVRCVVSYNTKINSVGMVLKYGEGAAGIVAQTGKPLIIDDYRIWSNRAAAYEKDKPFGAVLSAPMIWQSKVVGVIHVLRYDARRFAESDLELLTLFANHATVAVENSKLIEEVQQHSMDLEKLVDERTWKLRESEARYRRLFESSPISLWEEDFSEVKKHFDDLRSKGIKDLREYFIEHPEDLAQCAGMVKILNVNESTLNLYGVKSVEEIRGELRRIFTNEYEDGFREELVALGEGKTRFESEFDNQTLTGDTKHVSLILSVIPGYEDTLAKVMVSIIDLTEQMSMQEDLRSAKKRLEHVIESNPAIIYIAQPLPDRSDYYATYQSKSTSSITGFEPEAFIGEKGAAFWASRVHPDDLASYRAATDEFWTEGHQACEYRLLHKNGTYRWIREEANIIRDSTGNIRDIIGYWTDITDRKRMEGELLKSNRLAAIGETASMVAHDLRNPLQGITTAIHLLKQESLTAKERNELLRLIQNSVEYSESIVRDLTAYAAEIQLNLIEATPKSTIREALGGVKVPPMVTVHDNSEEYPRLRIDSDKMRRVMTNIIENAIDAMPQGGTLTISSKESDGNVEIDFSDTGSGFPEKIMQNLWKPLQTTKAKGMGLGLAICKRIVDAHGGSISVTSKAGEGTTVKICLPTRTVEVKPK